MFKSNSGHKYIHIDNHVTGVLLEYVEVFSIPCDLYKLCFEYVCAFVDVCLHIHKHINIHIYDYRYEYRYE